MKSFTRSQKGNKEKNNRVKEQASKIKAFINQPNLQFFDEGELSGDFV